ncbi:H3K27me3 methyltransferase [Podospora pseudopauciseta]|uniref:H3K27me3 methyltransferase n=1 Tax=Podospora pseudopauciseta TaxID=2093780 RepID=A0ABR0HY65_9PEZI|nr:H3K27me3 methyltransferase [Podospora pseudopauciseta]
MVSSGRIVVDLTADSTSASEDGGSEGGDGVADETGVRTTTLNHPHNGDRLRSQLASQPYVSERPHHHARNSAPQHGKASRGPSPSSLSDATATSAPASRRRTPNGSPVAKSKSGLDGTPSKSIMRFSTRDEIRDSQSPTLKNTAQHPTPQSQTSLSLQLSEFRGHETPKSMTPQKVDDWTVDSIADILRSFVNEVSEDHAHLVHFLLDEDERNAPKPQHISSVDAFADMKPLTVDHDESAGNEIETMTLKFKQHSGEQGKAIRAHGKHIDFPVVCIASDRQSVPRYRFHHVEIRKNILAPNSMLNFVPHLRDVDPNSAEEKRYAEWLNELETLDKLSGFKALGRVQRLAKRAQNEYAAILSTYLEPWLERLAIDGCTKTTLIRYMASQPESDDAITPQQRSHLLDTYNEGAGSPRGSRAAKLFTEAFDKVFGDPKNQRPITLSDVLKLDKAVEPILDNRKTKNTPSAQRHQNRELTQKVVESLGSYSALGCLICFSHDCEHGEIDGDNQKRCLSLDEIGGVASALRAKWMAQLQDHSSKQSSLVLKSNPQPCRNSCYRTHDTGKPGYVEKPWSGNEVTVLEQVFATLGYSSSLMPQCFVAAVLNRPCWDVHRKFRELSLALPAVPEAFETVKGPKPVTWYDRRKKQLLSGWEDATVTHEHSLREIWTPCHHEGACTAANGCQCASKGRHPVLCERFCLCTAETCALKFTGCACHSLGKTCIQRQKEGKPCICVQLNRECDPVLCKGCGAKERADPENAYDEQLHSTGCQNVPMQRGATKAVVIGSSQLEGCGYGLFAAEDIAQDEFIIEYTGELISHDEGVRRENRRGDVFDEENKISYLFTLLEQEGIWVDAAIYGNLSRYINHANDTCNITPKIMYVNHEFRIKFSALRDIKAGEELFFNYGDNFPNLTKKLVESRESGGKEKGSGNGAPKRKGGAQRAAPRKTTSKSSRHLDYRGSDDELFFDELRRRQDDEDGVDYGETPNKKQRGKRGGARPGAGRKKKQAQPAEETGEYQHATEISDSQGESGALEETPSRRRISKHPYASTAFGANGAVSGPGQEPVKKISKRGGARPGAGRKPKHRPGTAKTTSSSKIGKTSPGSSTTSPSNSSEKSINNIGRHGTDSEDHPLAYRNRFSRPGPSTLSNSISTTAAGKKRKASDFEEEAQSPSGDGDHHRDFESHVQSNRNNSAGLYRQSIFQPIDSSTSSHSDQSVVNGRGGGRYNDDDNEGDEDDDDDDDSVRGSRKRQKPWRYRDEKE